MRKKVSGYLNHKSRNLAKVVIDGRMISLGEYGSSESHEVYQRVIAEWLAAKEALDAEREPLTVNELCDAFWGFGLLWIWGCELQALGQRFWALGFGLQPQAKGLWALRFGFGL